MRYESYVDVKKTGTFNMVKDYYRARAVYEKISRGRLEAVRTLMPHRRPLTVLDVGCGSGTLGASLKSDPEVAVFGVDIAPSAIALAEKQLDGAWIVDIESSDAWSVDITCRLYDVIIISEVLEHLFEPERLLSVIRPILAQNGSVIITVPNILFWRNRLRIFFGHFEYEESGIMDRGHIHFFSWRSFQDLLRAGNFSIHEAAHVVPTRVLRPFGRILPGWCAKQFAVRARML